jgi:CRISPR-associated protein Cas5h
MNAIQFDIEGNWGHFRRTETNNNPLSHDFITKTALIGLIGAVLGIERKEMKDLFPILSEDLVYGIRIKNDVNKQSWGFTLRSVNDAFAKSPKQMEFIRNPSYSAILGLRGERSKEIFTNFIESVENSNACYTPILGLHNCPAELIFKNKGLLEYKSEGEFETYGFVSTKHKPSLKGLARLGFDRIPTFQNNDFWNLPEKYVQVIYPSNSNCLSVSGEHYIFNNESKWFLI